jgi:tol-pal system protein YbgF
VLSALCVTLAGCAGSAVDQDVADLRRDLNTVMTTNQRLRAETESRLAQAERRGGEQQSQTSRQIAALEKRLDGVNRTLERVSGRLDEMASRLEALRAEARARPAAREPAPRTTVFPPAAPAAVPSAAAPLPPAPTPAPATATPAPSTAMPAPPTAPAPSVTPAPPTAVTPPPAMPRPAAAPPTPPATTSAPGPASPAPVPPAVAAPVAPAAPSAPSPPRAARTATAEETYQAAYLDLSRGRYVLAASAFREFIRRFPDSPLADSAQYGIGEAYFSLAQASASQREPDKAAGQWAQAVQEFRKVSLNYPRGSKVPTALYKEALALTELRQTEAAQARLRYLVDHFPQSAEAPLAKEKLAALPR